MADEEGRGGRSAAWGVAAGVFGAGTIAAWQAAIAPGSRFPSLPAYVLGLVAAVALYMCFATVWGWWPVARSAADRAEDVTHVDMTSPPDQAMTDRWRLTINDISSEVLQLADNAMSHPGYMGRSAESLPPSVRIGMSVACAPLEPATPTTSEVRARFLSYLGRPPVMDLVQELTALGDGLAWRPRDDNPRHNFAAILSLPDTDEPPVAWARLLLPEEMARRYGRDFRRAYFLLYVEPRSADSSPAPAASLVSWHQRLSEALKLPAALAAFLAEQLGLSTSADPAAEIGVWLKAVRVLTELIDVDGYASVEGSAQSNSYTGFAMADPDGQPPGDLAETWLRQLCDSALHLDGYEADLASLRPGTGAGQPNARSVTQSRRATLTASRTTRPVMRRRPVIVGAVSAALGLVGFVVFIAVSANGTGGPAPAASSSGSPPPGSPSATSGAHTSSSGSPSVPGETVITSPPQGSAINNSQSIQPSPVLCGFSDPNRPFTFARGLVGTIEPATSISLPSGMARYVYVGSDAGGNPLTNISWNEDQSVAASYSGNKSVSIGRSPNNSGSFNSNGRTNVAIAGLGIDGYRLISKYPASKTFSGTSPAISVTFTTGTGDLALLVVGGQGVGLIQHSGVALRTLVNDTYSECGSNVIASAAEFAGFVSPGSHTASFSGTTYGTNAASAFGVVAYVLAPAP